MKIKITSLTFTPTRRAIFKDCAPFEIFGVTVRCEHGVWRYSHPNRKEFIKTKEGEKLLSKKYSSVSKYLKAEGIRDAHFSHWEEIQNPRPFKIV